MLAFALVLAVIQSPPPRSPDEERASFHLPEGFEIALVVAEPQVKKIVDVAFDDAGSMWATTASEYPRDANEDPSAEKLYANGGGDQVLVIEQPWKDGPHAVRVFADGLVMPMSVLPMSGSAIVQNGHEILKLSDTDGDGRAERREVLLSGFGVQDSHLMPHRFLRGPDGWIYTAQGAFNSSLVVDKSGHVTRFDHCKLGRFRPDGWRFELVAAGLNNIWGIVFDRRGQFWIQEANDLGYSVVPLERDASFPGIGMERVRQYSPWQPPLADFRMGGTGLSGLALSECSDGFPPPWRGVLFLANPIERRVQSVRVASSGTSTKLERGPDFLSTDDARFRPIAVHFGPDESLYVVDWYNPIISHNEVPRTHPERDRVRTRVWRIRHRSMPKLEPRDFARAAPQELLASLESTRTWESRAAWHEIVDRGLLELVPVLKARALDKQADVGARMLALWCLEGLKQIDAEVASELMHDAQACVRRDALRGFAASGAEEPQLLALGAWAGDRDARVRAEWIRVLDELPDPSVFALEAMLESAPPPITGPTVRCEQDGAIALTGEAHERAFERFLVRKALEGNEELLRGELTTPENTITPEGHALADLALDDALGAGDLALTIPRLGREATAEELTLLSRFASDPRAAEQLAAALDDPSRALRTIDALLETRGFELGDTMRAKVIESMRVLKAPEIMARTASNFRLRELEPDLAEFLKDESLPRETAVTVLRVLAALGSVREELFDRLARGAVPGDPIQREAVQALAACRTPRAAELALALMPDLPDALRRQAAESLSLFPEGARALVRAAAKRDIDVAVFDERTLERLRAALGDDPELAKLLASSAGAGVPVLELHGGADDCVDTNLDLDGAFTVEAWVQLDEPITNNDGLLAGRDFDINFAAARLRLWYGPAEGDAIIARMAIEPGRWTHCAVTRAGDGTLRIYLNGELDVETGPRDPHPARALDIGRTTPGGTRGCFAEVRVWRVERTASEIQLNFQRSLEGERPASLAVHVPGDPVKLTGNASIATTLDRPPLRSTPELERERELFDRFRGTASRGDATLGRAVFERSCLVCHTFAGKGETVGPPLDGVGLRGIDGILAAVLRPSAAVESGYRLLRVELTDETALEGVLVAQDDASLTLRPATSAGPLEARRIPRTEIARTRWSELSVMPDGLLETLSASDAANLLAFLLAQR
jgi:putative membrane-bound dehydrogenase-like protein